MTEQANLPTDGLESPREGQVLALTVVTPPRPEMRAPALRGAPLVAQQTTGAVPPLDFPAAGADRAWPEAEAEPGECDLAGVAAYLARLERNEAWASLTQGQGRWRAFAEMTHETVTEDTWTHDLEPPWARYRFCVGSQGPGTVRIFLRKEHVEERGNEDAYRGMLRYSGPGLVASVPGDRRGVIIGWDDALIAAEAFPPEAFEVTFEADQQAAPVIVKPRLTQSVGASPVPLGEERKAG